MYEHWYLLEIGPELLDSVVASLLVLVYSKQWPVSSH